jgi:hypothetical protein
VETGLGLVCGANRRDFAIGGPYPPRQPPSSRGAAGRRETPVFRRAMATRRSRTAALAVSSLDRFAYARDDDTGPAEVPCADDCGGGALSPARHFEARTSEARRSLRIPPYPEIRALRGLASKKSTFPCTKPNFVFICFLFAGSRAASGVLRREVGNASGRCRRSLTGRGNLLFESLVTH